MEYEYKMTTHGRAAMAAALALEKPLSITRVAFGSGMISEEAELADQHELLAYVSDGAITERRHEDDRLFLTLQYANAEHPDVKTFQLAEFMVFCTDPVTGKETDMLYATLGDYPQPVPAHNTKYPACVFNFPLVLILSSEIQVSVLAPAGLVTQDELERALVRHDADQAAHADLLAQYAKIGQTGEPNSAVLLDKDGKIPETLLPENVFQQGIPIAVITILQNAWEADEDGPRPYCAQIACGESTDAHIPYATLDSPSVQTAADCGMYPQAEAGNGVLRFWADRQPTADIIARVALLGPGNGACGGAGYSLPVATAARLGGVKIGGGVDVTADGTVSVDGAQIIENAAASDESVEEMLDDVFAHG